jgi:D-alanine-D-alanine ligase
VKWDKRYQEKYGITTRAAADLSPAIVDQLEKLSRRIYKALHLSGYARMDFRLRADGTILVLEANANPNLSAEEDFADSALAVGINYDELLERILQVGLSYQAPWREG